ncbi:MAG: helix-turn-helix domain-containing protein [Bacteroidaceae bacterium]|nr:helix-turn-helix domain-containing protein [Bacteroidaceae bacterium]
MPYKSEKIPIAGTKLDLRRKLSDEQRRAVKILADQGYSQRKLAEMFGCSKGTIQQIVAPQKKVAHKYPKEYWTEAKRRYRERKQKLFKSGTLQETKKRKRKQYDKKSI